jgi:hypothetical protein
VRNICFLLSWLQQLQPWQHLQTVILLLAVLQCGGRCWSFKEFVH